MIPAEVFLTFILMLSIFLGFELINKVPATLHTPLMSGANAISGITLVGAVGLVTAIDDPDLSKWLGGGYSVPVVELDEKDLDELERFVDGGGIEFDEPDDAADTN